MIENCISMVNLYIDLSMICNYPHTRNKYTRVEMDAGAINALQAVSEQENDVIIHFYMRPNCWADQSVIHDILKCLSMFRIIAVVDALKEKTFDLEHGIVIGHRRDFLGTQMDSKKIYLKTKGFLSMKDLSRIKELLNRAR